LSLIILTIPILFLAKQLSRPIRRLANNVDNIKKGGKYQNIRIEGNAEVKILSKSFNVMLNSIRSYEKTLKKKIEERTKELQVKNTGLERISRDKSLLIREIHHRIKNNLQIISSLLSLELRNESRQDPNEVITNCKNRINSMGLLHDMLYNNTNYVKVNASDFLDDIAKALKETIASMVNIKVFKNTIEIDGNTAIGIGLITNEAVTNAIKHGFGDDPNRQVIISIHQVDDNLVLKISNNGRPLDKSLDINKTESLGMTIIKAFSERINGKLTFENNEKNEVLLEIIFPVTLEN
jgi:two-component sensor histidine kinase